MDHRRPEALARIAAAFDLPGPPGPIEPLGRGLINDTFKLAAGGRGFVLQRINPSVFPNPEQIMTNLLRLSEQACGAGAVGLRIPGVVRARDGRPYSRGTDGALWRLMELVEDGVNLPGIESLKQAAEVGRTLGRFHRLAAGLPEGALAVSLPGFHHTPDYLERHLGAREGWAQGPESEGAEGRAVRTCFEQIDRRRGLASVLHTALAEGRIGERVIHGDPKLDNVLYHRVSGQALALIDLDTVQPGLIQHDLGDCLRSCCNRSGEAPASEAGAEFDLGLAAAILAAYGEETRGMLGAGDIAVLYDAIRLMPFELALRFLTDHLEGDPYFRVSHRGQNLYKARVQLALLADIESKEPAIHALIAEAFRVGDGGSLPPGSAERTAP
jgi:Ser/Thr protein kinase RdoA (MazF antagonist)